MHFLAFFFHLQSQQHIAQTLFVLQISPLPLPDFSLPYFHADSVLGASVLSTQSMFSLVHFLSFSPPPRHPQALRIISLLVPSTKN